MKAITPALLVGLLMILSGCAVPVAQHRLLTRTSNALIDVPFNGISRVPQDVHVAWSPPITDTNLISGYTVYFSTDPDVSNASAIALGNVTNAVVTNLTGGVEYYFAVTDSTWDGIESDFSSVVGYVVPLKMDLSFTFNESVTNVVLESSADLNQWSKVDVVPTNGIYRVTPNGEFPVEFFRAVGQSIEAL